MTEDQPLTALQAVAMGACSGHCLVAHPDTQRVCDCTCRGAFHGVLADTRLPETDLPHINGRSAPEHVPGQQELDLAVAS